MKPAKKCKNIEEIRSEIDRIDNTIIAALAERLEYVHEATKFKADVEAVLATERHEQMLKNRTELCRQLNIDQQMIESVYKLLLDYYKQQQLKLWKQKNKD